MSKELEELRHRLELAEKEIKELRSEDLLIAKMVAGCVVPLELNIATRTMNGERARQFHGRFSKKEEELKKRVVNAKTTKEVFDLLGKFDSEVGDYIRATKVATAEKAMEIAHSFIKKYSPVALPLKAVRENDTWLVDIDVGALAVKVAKIKVDAKTSDIISYDIPTKSE
jgi:hypothetical protein